MERDAAIRGMNACAASNGKSRNSVGMRPLLLRQWG